MVIVGDEGDGPEADAQAYTGGKGGRGGRSRKKGRAEAGAQLSLLQPAGFHPDCYPGLIASRPDQARFFLDLVRTGEIVRRCGPDDDQYVPLHSDLLTAAMGDANLVKPVKAALVREGLIECDGSYIVGEKALGYRVGPALAGSAWERFAPAGRRVQRRIAKVRAKATDPRNFSHPVHHHLHRWAQRVEIGGDPRPVLAAMRKREAGEQENAGGPRWLKSDVAREQVELYRAGHRHWSVCEYGRFHSAITSMCRELRPLLRIDGEPLAEIDIACSQPFFLALLLLRERATETDGKETNPTGETTTNTEATPETPDQTRPNPPLPYYVHGLAPPDGGLGRFVDLVTTGRFYDAFAGSGRSRDELKRLVFTVLYGTPEHMMHSPLAGDFRLMFPAVFDAVMRMKATPQPGVDAEDWHCVVGRQLQTLESQVMIGAVCERLRAEFPEVPVVTVHDSILTTAGHLALVRRLIEDAFNSYPIRPMLKEK